MHSVYTIIHPLTTSNCSPIDAWRVSVDDDFSTWQLSTAGDLFYCRRLTLHIHNTAYIRTLPLAWNNMNQLENDVMLRVEALIINVLHN